VVGYVSEPSKVPSVNVKFLETETARLGVRWRRGEIAGGACAGLYFLYWQIAKHGRGFAARKRKIDPRPEPTDWVKATAAAGRRTLPVLLCGYLDSHQFRGVSAAVPTALCQWLRGCWSLELCERIPSALDVLRAQARGSRAVTAIMAYPRLLDPVLNKPDAFAFFLHDLEHAFKFLDSPALHAGQRAFFAALESALDRGVFEAHLEDPVFAKKFDYLMSDMNTHPQHSRQYLRAILIESYLHREAKPPVAPVSPSAQRSIDRVMSAIESPTALAVNA
jgi:hypothetical protein